MTGRTYASSTAMRTALKQRLRDRHSTSKLPLDRLRREVALQRLLARISAAAPAGSWALKGGIAMIARLGERARTTADADATWRADREQLRDMLDNASAQDLGDHFEFTIGQGTRIEGEGPDNGLRFPVTARLASRIFEQIRHDVNIVTEDPRPIEDITLRNLLDFADIPSVTVPAIKLDQQLAKKLHAYNSLVRAAKPSPSARQPGLPRSGRLPSSGTEHGGSTSPTTASSSRPLPPLTALSVRSGNRSLPSKARTWPGTLAAGHGPHDCEPVNYGPAG